MHFVVVHDAIRRGAEGTGRRAKKSIALKRRKRREVKRQEGTPQSVYLNWIKAEIEQESACLDLPFTLVLLASFAAMSISYIGQDTVKLLESAIITDVRENANFAWAYNFGHKNIEDVNSYADFWSWNRLGFVPLLFPAVPWPVSEALGDSVPPVPGAPAYNVSALPARREMPGYRRPTPVKNDYLRFNRIVGGVRFRQEVAASSTAFCRYPGEARYFVPYIGKECVETKASGDEEMDPDLYATELPFESAREEWLLAEDDVETMIRHILDMEDGCVSALAQNRTCLCQWCSSQQPTHPWLNELTSRAEISFLLYNAQYGVHCEATVNFWFNRAGHIHKRIHVRSAWAGVEVRDVGTLFLMFTAAFIWAISNVYVLRLEAREIIDAVWNSKKAWYLTIIDDYIGFWNCVDWVSMAIAAAVCVMFALLAEQTGAANAALAHLASGVTATAPAVVRAEAVQAYSDAMMMLFGQQRHFRTWLCIYPTVLMMRLFKSFAAQPRLAVVTETFKNAASDMFHFFIVFASVYFCMSLNAVLFFGQDDVNFARLDWALFHVWRVMLGDWDWESLRSIGREKAFAWFSMLMLVVVVIMMNILISILMGSYAEVKRAADHADSLFRQVLNMIRRARETRKGKRVRLNDIQDAFLQDASMNERAMLSNPRLLFPLCRVVLDRREGDALGLDFDTTGSVVYVRRITVGGLAQKHNLVAKTGQEIRVGDVLVEVNGVHRDANAMLAELGRCRRMRMRLRRTRQIFDPDAVLRTGSKGSLAKQIGRSRSKLPVEPVFLMDMVQGIPETQAHRTLKNSMEAHNKRFAEPFGLDQVEQDLNRIMERMRCGLLCAGWLSHRLREYEEALESAPTPRPMTARDLPEAVRRGIDEVGAVAQQQGAELAEEVAAVLGEEMATLERRQREQTRSLSHAQDSVQGLRNMIYNLSVACGEVGHLAEQLGHRGRSGRAVVHVPPPEPDTAIPRAKLAGRQAIRSYGEDVGAFNRRGGGAAMDDVWA